MTALPGSQSAGHYQGLSMNERKQRVPEGHVCVTLLNSVSATLSKEPFDLRSAIGSLPTESWAQKPLLGSDLHHPSLFLAEAPTVCPRPFQVPLSFQLWALMNWLFAMQPEEKGSSVGQSGNAESCLQPYLGFSSTTQHPCGYRTAAGTVQEVLPWVMRRNTR